MAYTKIIAIKTTLNNSLKYITQKTKTEDIYIGSINCRHEKAYQQMRDIKIQYGKTGGRLGYHLIQSFKVGEAPETKAFQIAQQFADEYLGNRFQVVFATHIDKDHIHNHYIWNSVSFSDGKKYIADKNEYTQVIQKLSDKLCLEHGLSVIEPNENSISKHYAEWSAEKKGHPTWRSMIKADIDNVINVARDFDDLIWFLKSYDGYEINTGGKNITLKGIGMKRPVRLKSLGLEYSKESIEERIEDIIFDARSRSLSNVVPRVKFIPKPPKGSGWVLWYNWYHDYMKEIKKCKSRPHPVAREELIKFYKFKYRAELIWKYQIKDMSDLTKTVEIIESSVNELVSSRNDLEKNDRKKLNDQLRVLRRELYIIDELPQVSEYIKEKMKQISPRLKKFDREKCRQKLTHEYLER